MRTALLCLAALTGCGPITHDCTDLIFGTIKVEEGAACPSSRASMLASEMIKHTIWPEFDGTGFDIVMMAEDHWTTWGVDVAGHTIPPSTIYVGKSEIGLLHEMMHVRENWRGGAGAPSNYDHIGWDTDGRWALSNLFMFVVSKEQTYAAEGGTACAAPALPDAYREALLADQSHWDWWQALHDWDSMNHFLTVTCGQ